jgi:hypothetical protein
VNSTHTGIEKLVALANLSPDWRKKVQADPLAAADEAELELSESERAIIASVPRATLEQMLDSIGSKLSRPVGLLKLTASAAAAALLAGSLAGCDGCSGVSRGISPDRPPEKKVDPDQEKDKKSEQPDEIRSATQGVRPDIPQPKPETPK